MQLTLVQTMHLAVASKRTVVLAGFWGYRGTHKINKDRSNSVKHNITCRYLLSYSPRGSTHCKFSPGVYISTPFWGMGGRRGSAMASFERAMVVSYRLSIVTIALSVTIWLQLTIECL